MPAKAPGDAPTLRSEGEMIRVSGPVKDMLRQLQSERHRILGRVPTFCEVIEHLIANQKEATP